MSRLTEDLSLAGAQVEVLSLNPRKHRDVVSGPVPVRSVDIDTSALARPLLRSLYGDIPWIVARFVSASYEAALDETLRRVRPELVQIESPFLLPYAARVRAAGNAPVVLRSLNVEFRIWEGLAHSERSLARRVASRQIARSLRAYELREMERVDAILPISEADAGDFRLLGCTRPMHVVPCSVALPAPSTEEPAAPNVGFIGSLDFRPNQQAAAWMIEQLWPRVTASVPGARLSIGGSSPPDWLRRLAHDRGVDLRGDVHDAHEFVRGLSVFIAPIFAGGGMRIKVLDAMALGRPVVATPVGAGGIDVRDGRDILLAQDEVSFAAAVVRLLRDPAEAARIGAAARAMVAERYDGATIAGGLLRFYESFVGAAR